MNEWDVTASLLGSGVSLDSPLEGHSLRDLASITPGLARSFLFYFIFILFWDVTVIIGLLQGRDVDSAAVMSKGLQQHRRIDVDCSMATPPPQEPPVAFCS